MSILVDKSTRVVCQGMGKAGTFHATQCRDYGTQMVGGIAPGKGGTVKDGFPLFNTVAEAVRKTGANASMVFVPPGGAADAIMEAADAGIGVIVAITEGIPVLDMVVEDGYLVSGELLKARQRRKRVEVVVENRNLHNTASLSACDRSTIRLHRERKR